VSEWGHDFRPAYRAIGEARAVLGEVATLAVTATATERVAADVIASLRLRSPFVWRGTFLRPNLLLAARAKDRLSPARATVLAAVRAHAGASGVVYCLSRRDAGSLATYVRAHGGTAAPYHAGMPQGAREDVQTAFREGALRTVVATVAFGMGIDKSDVRYVIHADLPASVESYAQEIGRAGRDGLDADCLLLYSWTDVRRRMAMHGEMSAERRADARRRLFEVYELASGDSCRHRALCAYFTEEVPRCATSCDACGGRAAADMAGERPRTESDPLVEWEDPP
jgi:ATP-dependent DNA helicase RecQ